MSWLRPQTWLDRTYVLSLGLKALDGVIEVLSGLLLLLIGSGHINQIAQRLTSDELAENPHNILANFILHSGQHLAGATTFVIVYLLAHGILKLVVVISLLQQKPWAYPLAFVVLGLFLIYQLFLLIVAPSLALGLLSAFDLLVLWLIWREYRHFKDRGADAPTASPN